MKSDFPVSNKGVSPHARMSYAEKQPTPRSWFAVRNSDIVWGQSPGYVGTINTISLPGAYYVSPIFRGEKVLIRGHNGEVSLEGNLCSHRQAPILKKEMGTLRAHSSHGSVRTCPIHRWSFDEKGSVIGPPKGFHNCTIPDLGREPVVSWRGFLFTDPAIDALLESFGHSGLFDPDSFNMDRFSDIVRVEHYDTPYSALVFAWNYLDCYHVAPAHPKTFGEIADTNTLKWEYGNIYSVQVVGGVPKDRIPDREDMSWASLAKTMYEHFPECEEKPFAVWALIYTGNIMLESYFGGHLLAVSYLVPTSPTLCDNIVEYYMSKEAHAKLGDGLLDDFVLTYRTSADEDDDLCKEIQAGWELIASRAGRMAGPFHDPGEEGIVHYLQWLDIIGFNFNV